MGEIVHKSIAIDDLRFTISVKHHFNTDRVPFWLKRIVSDQFIILPRFREKILGSKMYILEEPC